jgi:hypothetical protein
LHKTKFESPNLAAAVGTAVAGALLVGLLSAAVLRSVAENPLLLPQIWAQVNLDNITYISVEWLESVMAGTSATPEQVAEAVRINTEARLRALKIGLLLMGASLCWRLFRRVGSHITIHEHYPPTSRHRLEWAPLEGTMQCDPCAQK